MFGRKRCIFKSVSLAFALGLMILFSVSGAMGAEEEKPDALDELSLFELRNLETFMVTATKRKISTRKAPAIATVITADEIRNMGARDLTDVLKTVPGFGMSINDAGSYMFEVRGVKTQFSEKIIVMIDGHRLYDSYYGSALYHAFNDISVGKVKQIEIIRGPGSALYGANAFAAVVNIITKDADNVDGIETAVAGGSFDTKKVGILGGKSSGELKVFGSFDHSDTDGADVTIEADSIAGAPFSMSPGKADLSVERTEAFMKIASGDLILRGHYTKKHMGAYIGFTNMLTGESLRKYESFWTELGYSKSFTDKFSASFRTYFDYFEFDHRVGIFPKGFPEFSEGAVGIPTAKNKVLGAELQFDMDLSETNHLIFGFNFDQMEQYDVTHVANFNPSDMTPLGSFQDVSSWGNYCKDVTRRVWAGYLQDEWAVMDNLNLTTGVRYDYYDDFGSTTNPRIGLVWTFLKDADLKLLFGQAFRAPNFSELYTINNPVGTGNPDLKPETVMTYEAALGYRLGSYTANLNYFHSDIKDLIVTDYAASPVWYANMGGAKINGIEAVIMGKYSPANYWQLSYTWQNPEDTDTGEELPNVPSHRATLSVNWGITKYLNAHTDILWTGKRPRVSGDDRGDMPSYTTVDLTLIAKNFYKGFEIRGIVHNLFDKEYEDPDLSGAQKLIPYDYPREGISALIEVSYKF